MILVRRRWFNRYLVSSICTHKL